MKILTGIQKEKITMGTTLDASTVEHPQNYFLGGQRDKTAMGPSWASLHGAHVGFLWATHSGLQKTLIETPRPTLLSTLCGLT